jgi:integrase
MEQKLSNRRRYLTAGQLDQLIKDARKARYGQRDATLMLLMARHGLRVTEAVDLRWDQIDFAKGHLHVRRLKGGIHSVHPIQGDELRNLRELRREQVPESAFVFTTERGGPMTRSNVATDCWSREEGRATAPSSASIAPHLRSFTSRCGP